MTVRHLMVDLETWGTKPGSVIVSIGAVEFDPYSDWIGASPFYRVIDAASCMRAGLTVDASTITWWLQQSQEARDAITRTEKDHINVALLAFSDWARPLSDEGVRLWCHGPSFDAVMLQQAYEATGLPLPFKYNEPRDTRTLIEAADLDVSTVPSVGTAHNALEDAIYQAKVVQAAYRRQNLGLPGYS